MRGLVLTIALASECPGSFIVLHEFHVVRVTRTLEGFAGDVAMCCVSHFEASMVSAPRAKARAAATMLASKCSRSARVARGGAERRFSTVWTGRAPHVCALLCPATVCVAKEPSMAWMALKPSKGCLELS